MKYALKISNHNFLNKVTSTSVADGLCFFRTNKSLPFEVRKLFAKSEPVERLFRLLNDAFDVMNARQSKDGINTENWEEKKTVYMF